MASSVVMSEVKEQKKIAQSNKKEGKIEVINDPRGQLHSIPTLYSFKNWSTSPTYSHNRLSSLHYFHKCPAGHSHFFKIKRKIHCRAETVGLELMNPIVLLSFSFI